MRAIVLQHEEHEGLGELAAPLTEAGFKLVQRFRGVHHTEDLSAELVVVLGGRMSVAQVDRHPFLREELALLTERIAADRPCLGICLGAQLLAAAAGAEVSLGKNGLEVGAAPVRWTKAAVSDEVTRELGAKTVMAHWHEDTFSPVPGATLLGSTDRYTQQVFRVGSSYGFQCHPELTAATFGHWLDQGTEELELHGKSKAELEAQLPKLKAAEPMLEGLRSRLVHHFARTVR